MKLDILKHFIRKADEQQVRLAGVEDTEIIDMTALVTAARNSGIGIAPRMPDDSHTPLSAVLASGALHESPEHAARMAWANPEVI